MLKLKANTVRIFCAALLAMFAVAGVAQENRRQRREHKADRVQPSA